MDYLQQAIDECIKLGYCITVHKDKNTMLAKFPANFLVDIDESEMLFIIDDEIVIRSSYDKFKTFDEETVEYNEDYEILIIISKIIYEAAAYLGINESLIIDTSVNDNMFNNERVENDLLRLR